MPAVRPRRIRLRRPVFLAITFPDVAHSVIDETLFMSAVVGFGLYTGREVGGVNHTGKSSPVGGSGRELFLGI